MKELTYRKNLLTSSVLNDALDRQVHRLFGNDNRKAQLAYVLLNEKQKQGEFEKISNCVNAVKRNIASGNYRLALCFLAILQKSIDNFKE